MPASAAQRCLDDDDRQVRRKGTYRRYNKWSIWKNAEPQAENVWPVLVPPKLRLSGKSIGRPKDVTEKNTENKSLIEQGERRKKKNSQDGKMTKRRPKARHYWSDPELATESEQEDDDNCCTSSALCCSTSLLLARRLANPSCAIPIRISAKVVARLPSTKTPAQLQTPRSTIASPSTARPSISTPPDASVVLGLGPCAGLKR
ncbi:hypothetical protein C8R43DRAFT_1126332 [Mycena crocata]|nr:hypothetical protein C8R43DRAFT_1126332 [Mycena crocata]